MLAGMLSEGEGLRHAGYASPPPSTSSSGGGGLACVPPWVTPWDFEIRRSWATWCCRMLTRLLAWAHAVRCYLRLCGVWLCTTSRGLRSLQWNRRTRAHRLFLGILAVTWWRTFRKGRTSVPLPSTAPSRAHPQPSQDLHRSHDQLPLPRPAPSPLLLGCPLKSSSCPTLTRMWMLGMDREFVGLRSVCQTCGASLLRRMPSGLARPALGGWSPANDPGIRGHGDNSTPPPPPVRHYRVPSPSRVGGSDAVAPTVRPQRLVPKRRVPEVTECPPRKRPAVGQGLAPGRGVSATTSGSGGGGLWRPIFVMCPCHPRGPRRGRGRLRVGVWVPWLSAARHLTPRPPPPPGPQVVAGQGYGRCASWSRVVDGGPGGGGWQWPGISRRNKRWMWGIPRGGWVTHMPGGRPGRRPRQWRSCGLMGRWSWRE